MEVYLVQHAKSRSKEEDPERPLSDEGFKEVEKVAAFAGRIPGVALRKIIHSGKLRARQTAEVMAASLHPAEGLEEVDGLDPLADPSIWAERMNDGEGNIMLVGHLPHLENLAGVLLCGETGKKPIKFQNAGIIRMVRNPDSEWLIDWIIVPSIIGS